MTKIMVANPKGGSGKSTVAVHLATWFAYQDERVCLGDLDRQQSSASWLLNRPEALPQISAWQTSDEQSLKSLPKDCKFAIIDTPAGLYGKPLKQLLKQVDRVVVPVCPSSFDMKASQAFFEELAEMKAVRKEKISIATIGMRIDTRTKSAQQLVDFLGQFDFPMLTSIRDTQRYVQSIQAGLSLFDLPVALTRSDRDQWRPLLDWLVQAR